MQFIIVEERNRFTEHTNIALTITFISLVLFGLKHQHFIFKTIINEYDRVEFFVLILNQALIEIIVLKVLTLQTEIHSFIVKRNKKVL